MSEMTSLNIIKHDGTMEYRGIFHGIYRGTKSMVPRNTTLMNARHA